MTARFAIAADHLLAGDGRAMTDAAVVIEGDRIAAIARRADLPALADSAQVRDYGVATIAPGLVDAHVHVTFSGDGRPYEAMMADSDERLIAIALENAARHLRAGVTTMRDLGARDRIAFAVRDTLASQPTPLPQLLIAGRPVTATGGHMCWCHGAADGERAIREAVGALASEGVDCIKLVASGGGTSGTLPFRASYTAAELRAGVAAARGLGLATAAHCHATESIDNAASAGVDCIEHVSFLADRTVSPIHRDGASWSGLVADVDRRVLERLAQSDCYLGMTLLGGYSVVCAARRTAPVTPKERRRLATAREHSERKQAVFAQLAGVGLLDRMVVSTDAGAGDTPFGELHLAAAAAVEAGASPAQAIASITSIAAAACGLAGEIGTLDVGRRADIVVVAGDVSRDISLLGGVRAVYRDGALAVGSA